MPQTQKRLLRHVLGRVGITEQPFRKARQAFLVRLHDLAEDLGIPGGRLPHSLVVVHASISPTFINERRSALLQSFFGEEAGRAERTCRKALPSPPGGRQPPSSSTLWPTRPSRLR